jgi:hypothetical protein
MVELLHEMSKCLGYPFDKAAIESAAYYPKGYGEAEIENWAIRKLWLDVLQGKKQLPMKAEVSIVEPVQLPPKDVPPTQQPTAVATTSSGSVPNS